MTVSQIGKCVSLQHPGFWMKCTSTRYYLLIDKYDGEASDQRKDLNESELSPLFEVYFSIGPEEEVGSLERSGESEPSFRCKLALKSRYTYAANHGHKANQKLELPDRSCHLLRQSLLLTSTVIVIFITKTLRQSIEIPKIKHY